MAMRFSESVRRGIAEPYVRCADKWWMVRAPGREGARCHHLRAHVIRCARVSEMERAGDYWATELAPSTSRRHRPPSLSTTSESASAGGGHPRPM